MNLLDALASAPDVVPSSQCECVLHALIAIGSNFPPCAFAEAPEIVSASAALAPPPSAPGLPKLIVEPHPEPIKLMEEDGFFIEQRPYNNKMYDKHESWVMHYCPSMYAAVQQEDIFMMKNEVCHRCCMTIPPGVIALWKLHNWDALQNTDDGEEWVPILSGVPVSDLGL